MSTRQTKHAKPSLKERLHKKARVATEPPRKSILKTTPAKPALKARPAKPPAHSPAPKKAKPAKIPKDTKGKAKAQTIPTDEEVEAALPSSFKIIAGSYERLLYGLEGTVDVEGSSHKFNLKPIFIFPAHISYIRAVAASPDGGKWLATGSGDEIIKVWDLRRRKEIGGLMQHEGSITHLSFPSRSHLLSASEDGTLCLFHARDWAVLRTLKGHKGRVNSVAVHPSGKLALSVGKDRTLRMWDLMRGRGSASTKLGKEGELVRWSITGKLFVVQTLRTLDVYSTDMELLHTITHPSRIHDIKFCKHVSGDGEVLLVAGEDKKVAVYNVPSDPEQPLHVIAEMVGHENRVKAVDTLSIALPPISDAPDARTSTTLVSTISSDGKVRVFDLADVPAGPVTPNDVSQLSALMEYDTKGTRLTSMAMAGGDAGGGQAPSVNGKRKRGDEDGEDEDEEDEKEEELPSGSDIDEDEEG
ncbi:WD40 repeat-like protein [Trametopsis cervina]|nr:WD40 repeat-like protein [Trametopsis cervina]